MKNTAKKAIFTTVWLFSTASTALANKAESTFWVNSSAESNMWLESGDLSTAIQRYVKNLFAFLYIIAVLLALYAGFLILTAAWNDDNIKKGKKILTQAGIWFVVIFLASAIVKFVIGLLAGSSTTTGLFM